MQKDRWLNEDDRALLEASLSVDPFHKDTPADFFYDPRSVCEVYEDGQGPVMFVRGTKALRIDVQFVNNKDRLRNAKAMLANIERVAEQARRAGFTELVFCTDNVELNEFAKKALGFGIVNGELRRLI